MQLTTAIFTTLCLALSATADQRICFPLPGQPSIPQSILDLDNQVKLDWASTLCSQLTFPSDGQQVIKTATADGILGDDGNTYGLELVCICSLICRRVNTDTRTTGRSRHPNRAELRCMFPYPFGEVRIY